MSNLNLKPHEEAFDVKPVGIRYICELCGEGEMRLHDDGPVMVEAVYPPRPPLRKHICTKCGGTMMLPKAYPYIEWVPVDPPAIAHRGTPLTSRVLMAKAIMITLPYKMIRVDHLVDNLPVDRQEASIIVQKLMDKKLLFEVASGSTYRVNDECPDEIIKYLRESDIKDEEIREALLKGGKSDAALST